MVVIKDPVSQERERGFVFSDHCCPNWSAFIESSLEIIVLLDGFLFFPGSGFNILVMMLSQLPESEIHLYL